MARHALLNWPWLALGMASMLIGLGMNLVVPWLLRWAIDVAIRGGRFDLLGRLAMGVVAVALVRGFFLFGERYSMEMLAQRVIYDLRYRLYQHLQVLPFSFYDRARTGHLLSRAISDVETLRRFLGFGLINLSTNLVTFAAVLVIMWSIHPTLTLRSLVTLPFLALVTWRFGLKVKPAYEQVQRQLASLTTVVEENITGARVVKAFGREDYERHKFAEQNEAYLNKSLEAVRLWSLYFPLVNLITALATAVLVWYGGREVIRGRITLGQLVAFNGYLLLLLVPLRMAGWLANLSQQALASAQRIYEILDLIPEIRDRPGAADLPPIRGEVRLEEVCFNFPGGEGRPVLRGVDLLVRPGETVALVGATGSGKTALVHLIPRFYDPTAGRILVDGFDIRDVTLRSLRRQVGMVMQDVFLFSATVRENIAFGRPEATMDEVIRAARAARIHDFITSLPRGYETLVGERGVNLSGGQKQRMAIARALLTDPRILILDDSTSSVDVETEHLIREALAEVMRGRTTFVIAQRLSTLRAADRVVVLDGGRIVQQGTHRELLEKGGLYAEICRAAREVTLDVPLASSSSHPGGGIPGL